VATESAGTDEGGAAAQGPSEEEIAELEARLAAGPETAPVEDAGAAEETDSDEGTVLSRAPAEATMEPASAEMENELVDDEPADQASIGADAQGELEAMGASGGPDVVPGGGGGGGGGPVEAQPEPAAPDVSNADPAAAVQAAASLKPAQMLETLGGAETAAATHVEKEQKKLQDNPPEIEAGGGPDGPSADEKFPSSEPSRPQTAKAALKTGGEPEKPAATPAPPPKAPLPAAPAVAGDERGNVGADGAAKIKASIDALPTADGAVTVPSITAPKTALTGAADPGQMAEQQQHLDQTVAKASAQGAKEAQEPAGEDHLAPTVKAEKIKAEIAPAGPGAAGGGAGGAGAGDEAVNVVADQESGPALKAQIAQASGQINSEKSQHAAKAAQDKAAAVEQAAAEEAKGRADQIAEHAAAKAGVSKARADWTSEQKQQADDAKLEAVSHVKEASTAIQSEKTKADSEAVKHVHAGVKEAEEAKRRGDEDARKEKQKAKEESSGGGFFGWVASKAKALYDKVKDGITNIFNKVRQAITSAINKAKEIAHSVIDKAVKFVADKIKAVANKLIALGDKLIPGFKALRTKFKNWIVARVKQAVAALNRIVTAVKDGIRRVMAAVGNALKAGLDLLKRGISAAINAVKNVVKAAIEKAKALIATLAQFAVIIKDVAAGPGAWIRNLGAAIMDGIKNHLWVALKNAISEWFNSKVESLLGLGKSVWNLLSRGGINMAKVGKMAWEAIKAAIPPALIAILVERLVSMIVPAAGAVMAIVQGLMAAWGAIQRILAAIDRFIAFLKAVKSGNAGSAFAQALAAAAVAVIEFVSQFLLRKIAGAASKVAGKIKAIAQKIGKRLMAGMKKVGNKLKKGYNKLKAKAKKAKEKIFGPKKKKDDKQENQDRLDKAVRELTPKVQALVRKGVGRLRLKAQLAFWKLRYRLSSLEITGSGKSVGVRAKVNPEADIVRNVIMTTGDLIHEQVEKVWPIVIKDQRVMAAVQKMREERSKNWEDHSDEQEPRKGGIIAGPTNRSTVTHPHETPVAASVDVGTGLLMADGAPSKPHTQETVRFLDALGNLQATTSERRELGGPGKIFVTGGGNYFDRGDISGMSPQQSQTFAATLLALQSGQPLPQGMNADMVKEFARLGGVEGGRDQKGAFVTVPMLAQLAALSKATSKEALLEHQISDVGGMDISRRSRLEKERANNVLEALQRGEDPKKRDLAKPWRGPRKYVQGGQKVEEPWPEATSRFWSREKEAVVRWLETRMLVDPEYFSTVEAFTNLLRNELPEYIAHHMISGTMYQLPASKPAGAKPGAVPEGAGGMLD
jgi:hypothetical protein